ncbi:MAG TPA: carbohydrate ABC transporter permease [Chloroflexota bacterium]|nr:carbohydrate ABC transporter permease [Chloroflexota bacterium]
MIAAGRRRRRRSLASRLFVYGGLLLFMAYMLGPVYVMVVTSVTPDREQLQLPPAWVPSQVDVSAYLNILFRADEPRNVAARGFTRSLLNTFLVASGVTFISVVLGSLAAYAYARLRMPLRDKLVFLLLFTEMLPGIVIVLPLFLTVRAFGVLDNLLTLIVLECSFSLPFTIWILRGYFLSLPKELEDAAMVDGCSRVGALFRVIYPIATPGLFAVSAFAFLGGWNAFFLPLIFTSSADTRTGPLAVAFLIGRFYVQFGLLAAAGTLVSLIPVLLAFVFQRYILSGLVAGALKG